MVVVQVAVAVIVLLVVVQMTISASPVCIINRAVNVSAWIAPILINLRLLTILASAGKNGQGIKISHCVLARPLYGRNYRRP